MIIVEISTVDLPYPDIKLQATVIKAVCFDNVRPTPKPQSRESVNFQPLWSLAGLCWKTEVGVRPSKKAVPTTYARFQTEIRRTTPRLPSSIRWRFGNSRLRRLDPAGASE